jgi:phenylpyruvate tautomerase PptA (4-oxalocrotonate tautomerase family)
MSGQAQPTVICDTRDGCAPVRVIKQQVDDLEKRTKNVEDELPKLHDRVTRIIIDEVQKNRWQIGIILAVAANIILTLLKR